jgi:hypothetical protein
MRTKAVLSVVAVASILVLSVAATSVSAFFVQGHSPITILLTDPNGNQFGCTSSGCNCPNTSPCTATGTDFVNNLNNSPKGMNLNPSYPECTPECVYFVNENSGSSTNSRLGTTYLDTYVDVPNPASGTWSITFYGNPESETTTTESGTIIAAGTFAITANTCGESSTQTAHSVGPNNNEGMGTCSVICLIPAITFTHTTTVQQPAHILCDADDRPIAASSITLTSGTVTGTSSGIVPLGIKTGGAPFIPTSLSTPEFDFGTVAFVAVLFVAFLMMRKYRES